MRVHSKFFGLQQCRVVQLDLEDGNTSFLRIETFSTLSFRKDYSLNLKHLPVLCGQMSWLSKCMISHLHWLWPVWLCCWRVTSQTMTIRENSNQKFSPRGREAWSVALVPSTVKKTKLTHRRDRRGNSGLSATLNPSWLLYKLGNLIAQLKTFNLFSSYNELIIKLMISEIWSLWQIGRHFFWCARFIDLRLQRVCVSFKYY